nr:uncharacterized protein DDB_G0284459-like [Aedes albopictus]
MGLKLKWFRRRITFEGIPSAPERNIRRKEHNSGVTAVGVYRQSVNFEDYIEPSRASYGEPPSQSFVTTTIRKPNTSSTSSTTIANRSSEKNNTRDKIARERTIQTPPEPNYSPPKPPQRRAITKTKSTPNISTLESTRAEPLQLQPIETTRSVEVLNEVATEPLRNGSDTQISRAMAINQKVESSVSTEIISKSENEQKKHWKQRQPAFSSEILVTANHKTENESHTPAKSDHKDEPEQMQHWKQQQPEFFNEILEKVNEFANTTNSRTVEDGYGSETESYDEIFEKVKAKPRVPLVYAAPSEPKNIVGNSYERNLSRHTSSSSVEDIFEPRPPEYIFAISMDEQLTNNDDTFEPAVTQTTPEVVPRTLAEASSQPDVPESSPKPLKSILKKRAPAPPNQQPAQPEVSPLPTEVPIPPPRAIRKQPEAAPKELSDGEDDDDDYLNWNMVERHRSSITHTVAAQQRVDPEIMRNVPVSLQQSKPQLLKNTRAVMDEEQPRTLRGMRNRQPASATHDGNNFLGLQGRDARNSESNYSEASA